MVPEPFSDGTLRHLSHEYNVSLEIFTIVFSSTVKKIQAQVGYQSWTTKTGGILFPYSMCTLVIFYSIEMI